MTVVDGDAGARVRAAVRSIAVHAQAANLERAEQLAAALDAAACDDLSDAERATAVEVAHQLVGSAGTFGFPGVSELASELETFFTVVGLEDPQRLATARAQLTQLRAQLAAEPGYIDGT